MKHNFIVFLTILMIFNNESNYCSASDERKPGLRINIDKRQNSSDEEEFSNPGSSRVSTRLTLGPPGSDHYRVPPRKEAPTPRRHQQSIDLTLATPGTSFLDNHQVLTGPESYKIFALQSGLSQREVQTFESFLHVHGIKIQTEKDLKNALQFYNAKLGSVLKKKESSDPGAGSSSDSRKQRRPR